jgi:hypothetical protein
MTDSPRTLPAEPSKEVYFIYGNVMHIVHWWELLTAVIWWQNTTPEAEQREAESKGAEKAIVRLERAFTKVTASQARRELEGKLEPELLDDIAERLDDRNRLAHRFLREQQTERGFMPGTLEWLGEAGGRFDASLRTLYARTEGDYAGVVRPHWPGLGQTILTRLFSGEPLDLEDALRQHPPRSRGR